MKVAIFGRTTSKENIECFNTLTNILSEKNIEFTVYKSFHQIITDKSYKTFTSNKGVMSVDFLISIGGDGTLLRTLKLILDSGIPVLGINTGRLGYLASTAKEDVKLAVQQLIDKEYTLDKRNLISIIEPKKLFSTNYALNECTVSKKDISSMITIHTYLNDEYLNSYWADGLIISTPTGSTGYSLSCAGPIILPASNNFVITPIAPHNLTVRPLVIPDDTEVKLKIETREQKILVTLDGNSKSIDNKTELTLKKEKFTVNLIKLNKHNHLATLRNKLMWGIDKRN